MNRIYRHALERIESHLQAGIGPWHRPWITVEMADAIQDVDLGCLDDFPALDREQFHCSHRPLWMPDLDKTCSRLWCQLVGYEHAQATAILMPNPPQIVLSGHAPVYRANTDTIEVPQPRQFATPTDFFAILFHEMGHATGHEKRLGRKTISGSIASGGLLRCYEEIVAELCSVFVLARHGMDNDLQAAAYIQHYLAPFDEWRLHLRLAARAASRASQYILWGLEEGLPYQMFDMPIQSELLEVQHP